MGKIDDLGLGSEILALRNQGCTLREIEDEIFRRYKVRISFASINNWLHSEAAKTTKPKKAEKEKARNLIISFSNDINKLKTNLCSDCTRLVNEFSKKWIEEQENEQN